MLAAKLTIGLSSKTGGALPTAAAEGPYKRVLRSVQPAAVNSSEIKDTHEFRLLVLNDVGVTKFFS